MQTLILTLLFSVATCSTGKAQNPVEVVITNFESEKGKALVGIYTSEEEFLETPWALKEMGVKTKEVVVLFEGIPAGTYAVSAVHDEEETEETNMFLGLFPMGKLRYFQ